MTDVRELTELAHRVRKLTETADWQLLEAHVRMRIDGEQRWLMNGHAKTVEDYRGRAGWLQGALYVLEAPDRLEEQARQARDEQKREAV